MPEGRLAYRRGDIRWVNLDPAVGAEARKIRSCLILQNDIGNRYGLLTIVPLLPGSKDAPCAVNVTASAGNELDKDRYIDVGQIRAVDDFRLQPNASRGADPRGVDLAAGSKTAAS